MLVYKITNKVNNLVYVGITTKSLKVRWGRHLAWARWQKPYALHDAINTYGAENFLVEQIVEATSVEELKLLEKKFIQEFNCLSPNGYNLTAGGQGANGYIFTEEVRKVMSQKAKAKAPASVQTRLRISMANTGRTMPREGVEKARVSNTGRVRTEKQKHLMSVNRKGKGLLNDAARKYSKEVLYLAFDLMKQSVKQKEIVAITGLSQSYLSKLKHGVSGKSLQGA